jgi:hypothetical protein
MRFLTYSFRRALATWPKSACGFDDGDIKLLGRWSSEGTKLHQAPTSRIADLARATLSPHHMLLWVSSQPLGAGGATRVSPPFRNCSATSRPLPAGRSEQAVHAHAFAALSDPTPAEGDRLVITVTRS